MRKLGLAALLSLGLLAVIVFSRADAGPEIDYTAQVFVVNSDGSGLRQLTRGTPAKSDPTWSPDGRRLGYADGALHVMTPATGTDRVVKRTRHNPAHQSLAWSPRRQELLYGFRTGADDLGRAHLAALRADGSGYRRLVSWRQDGFPLGEPAWAPNGKRIVYVRDRGELRDVAVIGRRGKSRRTIALLGDDDQPQWSPNGKSILFVNEHARSGTQLVSVSPRLRKPRRVGPQLVSARFPGWSHDGRSVAFAGHAARGEQQALYVLRVDPGATPQKIAPEASESAWSPVADLIAFADFSGNLRVIAPDGSAQRTLATFAPDTGFRYLAWSPDGRRLAFTAQKERPSD